ncbi:phage tail tip lysozyme [Tsukamurella paurometabola]|uniref:Phage-related protein n=1 Tax=Tsukamurella paurometabola TaxID=2061 RepID=A0A3P8KM53_TSUPA|nr:phage tail tip lysozyme [Tsukamurella paurometabola]UEA84403.1 transglycosylase SLT domain-containing protein [Tsukamurella paurometabola]VDR36967.1 Phage-related protein [Tsukamurella paurometabola]
MATYSAGSAKIDVSPSLEGFAERCRAELERMRIEYTIDVDADVSLARAQLEALARERTARIRVELDGAEEAEARLALLARNRTAHINVNVNGGNFTQINNNITNITNNAGRAERGLSSMGAVRFGGLAAAITALVPALVGAIGAASALGGVLAGIGGTAAVGLAGVGDAFKAMGDAANTSASDATAAANRITDAQDGVRRAQEGVADAQRDAKQAQDDLNDSYEKASRALRDMNDQLADAELSQEGAEIALARAQEARAKTYGDGKSTGLDRAEADLRVKEAQQRLKEAKSNTADQREDTAEANAKGIGGSDIVTDAQQKKLKADQALVNAQADLAKSMRDLADAQKGASAGADKYAEALAKLSPNARDFVTQMKALAPEWKNLRLAVQDRMFDGLGASVTQFAQQTMPGLRTTMTGIAGYMNGAFKDTLSSLSGAFQQMAADGTMQRFIDGIGGALQGMAPMVTGLVQMVTDATAAAGPALGQFFSVLGTTLGQLGPSLGQIGAQLLNALTPVLPVLGQLIQAISTGLGPALGPLGNLIASLGTALVPLAKPLGDLITALANGLAPILPSLGKLLGDLVAAVVPLIDPFMQLLNAILQPLISIISTVVAALAPFIQQLATALKPVIDAIAPVLAQVGQTIGTVLAQAIKDLTPVMVPMIEAFLKLVEAFLPMLPPMQELSMKLLPILVEGMKLILPVITELIEWFTRFIEWLMPKVVEGLTQLGKDFDGLTDRVRGFIDDAKDRWNNFVDFVKGLPGRISNAASGMWDGIKDTFKGALNWIVSAWNDFHISMKVPDSIPIIGGKGFTIDTPNLPLFKAAGGPIAGPGGPRADLIPAMLSDGEYVINAAAVAKYGVGMFDELNTQRFADGGAVGRQTAEGLNPGADQLRTLIMQKWPEIKTIGGRRSEDGYGEHSSGNAIDVMIPNYGTAEGKALGDAVFAFLQQNATALQLNGVIWRQNSYGYGGSLTEGKAMSDRGSDTQNHMDHLHVILGAGRGANAAPVPVAAGLTAEPEKPKTVDGQSTDGAYNPAAREAQDGRDDPQKYTPQATNTTTSTGSGPKSWSDVAGAFGEAFAKGQVSSLLSVFGVPDAMPPILTALGDLPSKIIKRDENWKPAGFGQLTTPTTGAGGTQTNPLGDLVGKFIPGLDTLVGGAQATPSTTGASAAPTAGPGGALPLTGQQGTPTTKTPVETLTSTLSAPPNAGYSGGEQATHDTVYAAFRQAGFTDEQWPAMVNIINRESGWNPKAKNPSSTAYGLGQFLDQTWGTVGGTTDDVGQQASYMAKYIKDRYGDPDKAWAFWQANGHYANGGLVFGPGGGRSDLVPAWLSAGEYVVNAAQAALHMPALEAINAGARVTTPMPPTPAASTRFALQNHDSGGRGQAATVNYNIRTATVEDAFLQAQTRQNQDRAAQIGNL